MIGPILRRAEAGRLPSFREVSMLLQAHDADYSALLETAGRVSRARKGEGASFRTQIPVEMGLNPASALQAVEGARQMGYSAVILRGEGELDPEEVAGLINRVKRTVPIHISLCLGERSYDEYALWRRAGAEQYILPHETCNPRAYSKLYPGKSPADRLTRYLWLRGLGYQVGGGLMADCMCQDRSCVVDDIEVLMNIGMESVFIRPTEDRDEMFQLIAVLRLCLPTADIWLSTDHPEMQSQSLTCGANTIVTGLPSFETAALL